MRSTKQAPSSRLACFRFGLLVLAACGGGGPSVDYADVDAAALEARCAYLVRCELFPTAASCTGYFRDLPTADRDAAKDAGKLDYDGEAAKTCNDALAALSCDSASREARVLPDACGDMFRGKVADGDACDFSLECVSGACVPTAGCEEGMCCVGTCGPTHVRHASGEACETDLDCQLDLRCGTDLACGPLGASGAGCLSDGDCDFGLGCIGALPPTPGDCRPLAALGEACPFMRCAGVNAMCNASQICVAVGLPGAACATGADCSPYASCDPATHLCAEIPALGQACTSRCAGDTWCEPTTLHCQALLENTAPCTAGNQCASYTCVEGPVFDSCSPAPLCF